MTEGITTYRIEHNKLKQKIAHRIRRKCEETFKVVKSDLEKALLFLTYLEPRVPSIQTQDASVTENTLKGADAQGVPGRYLILGRKVS